MKIPIKRGDTFLVQGAVIVGGVAQDCTDWSARCQIKGCNDFAVTPLFTWLDQVAGTYQLYVADTTDWPIEILSFDIEYTTDSGQIISTVNVYVPVSEDITI